MTLYTERRALEDHIKWIREERRRLSDEYWRSVERLRELDNKLNSKESNELVNQLDKTINVQAGLIDKLTGLIPKIPVDVAVEKFNEPEPEPDKQIINAIQIESQKDYDAYNNGFRRSSRQDITEITGEIASYLKYMNKPMRAKDIKQYMESRGFTMNNITNYLTRAMEINKNIVNEKWGYYTYKPSEKEEDENV